MSLKTDKKWSTEDKMRELINLAEEDIEKRMLKNRVRFGDIEFLSTDCAELRHWSHWSYIHLGYIYRHKHIDIY